MATGDLVAIFENDKIFFFLLLLLSFLSFLMKVQIFLKNDAILLILVDKNFGKRVVIFGKIWAK